MAINTVTKGNKTFKDSAAADTYNIAADAVKVTIAGKMKAGDIINVEGLASEYTVKASGRTITLKSDTQTIVFQLDGTAGAASVRFLDGSLDASFNGKTAMLGAQKLSTKYAAVNDSALQATDSSSVDFSGNGTGGSSGTTGSIFTLTSSSDVFSPNMANELYKSTAGNDTFRATAAGQLNDGDVIDAGAGTDSLVAIINEGAAQTLKPSLTNLENVKLNIVTENSTNGAITVDLGDSTGVVDLTIASDGAQAVTVNAKGVQTTDAITISGGAASKAVTSTITYDSVTGTADSATLTLKDVADVTAAGIETLSVNAVAYSGTITAADAKTVTITAGSDSKKTSTVTDIAQSTAVLATLNLAGSGETLDVTSNAIDFKGDAVVNVTNTGTTKLTIANLAASTNTLSVTGAGGKDQIDINAVTQGASIVVKTNDGDDQVSIDGANVTVDTGAGDDKLVVKTVASIDSKDSITLGAGNDTVSVSTQKVGAAEKTMLGYIAGAEILESTYTKTTGGTGDHGAVIDADAVGVVNTFISSGSVKLGQNGTASTAGVDALKLSNVENDDKFIITADMTGQQGKGASGGNGLNAIAKLDNATNVLNLEFVGGYTNTDGVDLAGGLKDTSGSDGVSLYAANFETVKINLVDKDADSDATTVATHDLSNTNSGAQAVGVTIGTNATLQVTGAGNLKLGTVGSVNATVDASALKGYINVTVNNGNVTVKGGSGDNTIVTGSGSDVIVGGAGKDTITGGTGGDDITAGGGVDEIVIAGGDSVGTIGGSGDNGTLTAIDKITGFSLAGGDKLNVAGTAAKVAATTGTNGTDSTLTIGGVAVKSHAISSDGVVTFDDADTFAAALSVDSMAKVAAVTQYLQGNDLGGAGDSVLFTATISGVAHTFVYTQSGASAGGDIVDLVGVTGTSLITSGTTAGGVLVM